MRPAFYPEGKGDSHWVTIDALPKKNIKTYTGSNKIDYALPTLLGDNHEQSQNFAEMLYAICNPVQWEKNIRDNLDNTDMRMFHDFHKDRVKYHNSAFWKRVQKACGQFGAIPPGTILKDEEGCHWLCYAAWADIPGSFTTKDNKARFVSLEGIKSKYEHHDDARDSYVIENLEEILPFKEAPACAVTMAYFANPYDQGAKTPFPELREQINKAFNINIADWTTRRDSALNLNGQSFSGNLYSINVAYYNEDDDELAGLEPFMRCVIDESGLGGDRDKLPKAWLYPRLRFFTKYSHDKDRPLMLFDSHEGESEKVPERTETRQDSARRKADWHLSGGLAD